MHVHEPVQDICIDKKKKNEVESSSPTDSYVSGSQPTGDQSGQLTVDGVFGKNNLTVEIT